MANRPWNSRTAGRRPVVWLAVWAVLSGLPAAAHAASPPADLPPRPNLRFDRFSAADGLSFSLTTSILQDRQGFLWFGTAYGLDKFDGFSFTPYLLASGGDVLSGNTVLSLYQDRAGDLWIATGTGLVRRDAATGEFSGYSHNPSDARSLGPGSIQVMGEDASGTLWIATGSGLSRYDPSTGTFTPFLRHQAVLAFYTDRSGGTWLGTAEGLRHYAPGLLFQQQPVSYRHTSDPSSISSDVVTAIHEDREGTIWVGTAGAGLNRLDPSTGTFAHFWPNPYDPYSLSDNSVSCILGDSRGRLWVGTYQGLNLFDRSTGRFFHYRHEPGDPHSIGDDQVADLYEDRSGVIWIATRAGISKVNDTASAFTHTQQRASQGDGEEEASPGDLSGLSDSLVFSVFQDSQGIVWVGTAAGGLNRLDRESGQVTVYQHDPADSSSLGAGAVNAIYEDRSGVLWIGTGSGLDRFNPQTGSFASETALWGQEVQSIAEDRDGKLWLGTSIGVMVREAGRSSFTSVPVVWDQVSTHSVAAIHPDRTGAVWISTQAHGLFRLDPDPEAGSERRLVHFAQEAGNPGSPGAGAVMSFYEDADGTLWMGGIENGLVRFNRDSQTFTQYLPDTGPGNYVGCVSGDAQGFLWVGTKLGLARFDPRSGHFSYYDSRDGLVTGEVMDCFQNQAGELFFGSWQGLNTFFPSQVRDNPFPPPVVITALNVRGRAVRTDLLANEEIRLAYRENYLSFDFSALDYTAPAKNQYAYRMEGLDADWVVAGARRHADYPDLKPGSYTFRVKASSNSGVWNEQGAVVRITIAPPFWQTWWFLGLLSVLVVGAVAGGVRLRLRAAEARSRDLEEQVRERTGALEQRTRELEQLYERSAELAVVEERSRLARELHDAVTQTLFSASLVAEALPTTWERDPEEGRGLLRELRAMSRGALAEMRTLLLELRPASLAEARLEDLLRQLGEAASGRQGIPVTVQVEGTVRLPPDVHIAFYRIAQEALNNVIKHARASQVIVRLHSIGPEPSEEDQEGVAAEAAAMGRVILLSIADDGRGFDPAQVPPSRLGLGIMHERAQAIGALLTVESHAGQGTQVTLLWEQEGDQEGT